MKGKRIVAVLLSVAMVFTGSGAVMAQESNGYLNDNSNMDINLMADVETEFAGGDGTEGNPYQVATADQLDAVRNDLDAYYIQTADIDLDGIEWVPIGFNTSSGETDSFTGMYNGNGYSIQNLQITKLLENITYPELFTAV